MKSASELRTSFHRCETFPYIRAATAESRPSHTGFLLVTAWLWNFLLRAVWAHLQNPYNIWVLHAERSCWTSSDQLQEELWFEPEVLGCLKTNKKEKNPLYWVLLDISDLFIAIYLLCGVHSCWAAQEHVLVPSIRNAASLFKTNLQNSSPLFHQWNKTVRFLPSNISRSYRGLLFWKPGCKTTSSGSYI